MSDAAPDALRSRRARDFVRYLQSVPDFPYATLISATTDGVTDAVTIDVEPELPQQRVVDILDHEQIRIEFDIDDAEAPRAYAERDDFPLGLVHTNYSSRDGRCWLCLWEESWSEVKARLDPEALLVRLRSWLERTAAGENHGAGQPLEPLLQMTSSTIILPVDNGDGIGTLVVAAMSTDLRSAVLTLATGVTAQPGFEVFEINAPPTVQKAYVSLPHTLGELDAVAASMNAGFLDRFRSWSTDPARDPDATTLFMLKMPKQSVADGPIEEVEVRAFTPMVKGGEVAIRLGLKLPGDGGRAPVLNLVPSRGDPDNVNLIPWRVVRRLDRAGARALSGNAGDGRRHIVAVGAGAIGSNVVEAAVRSGGATWTIVDDDIVLPHNTVRQAQGDADVGTGKASSLAKLANARLAETGIATALMANVLAPGDKAMELASALASADLVLDLTASPAALRTLVRAPGIRRVASLFFGPDGGDLVLLTEDAARCLRLDEVEAQYFWAVATMDALDGHLDAGRLDFVRYANACQDLTRPLPPWKVLTLSAIGARQVEVLQADNAASASVWRLDDATCGVARVDMPITPMLRTDMGDWKMAISEDAAATMVRLRRAGLPAETGGVLLGVIDLELRTVHVVGALSAPSDSRGSPSFFIRGAVGLRQQVDALVRRSAGMLSYVGEWHSHPVGAATSPSPDDETLFAYLDTRLGPLARPYVMAITGDDGLWLRTGISGERLGETSWPG